MVKEIHLVIKIFEKIANEIHLFPKNKKNRYKEKVKKKVIVKKLQKSQKSLKKGDR